MSISKMVTAE